MCTLILLIIPISDKKYLKKKRKKKKRRKISKGKEEKFWTKNTDYIYCNVSV